MLGFTVEAKGEVGTLCRRPEGSQEIEAVMTMGLWGPRQRGSLGLFYARGSKPPLQGSPLAALKYPV